jgi:tetratricopeptide (TPR) repeat protein
MSKKSKREVSRPMPTLEAAAGGGALRRLLGGRPRVAEVVALLVIALVIGVSAGYLVVRLSAAGPASQPGPDPAAAWRGRLAQNPNDLSAMLGLAHVHLDRQEVDAAESVYRQVLARDAKNVEAITHLGTVLLARGQTDAALAKYNEALALQPDYVHALWDKGNLQQQVTQDYRGAIRTWEAFIQAVGSDSPDAKTAQQFIAEAEKAMGR